MAKFKKGDTFKELKNDEVVFEGVVSRVNKETMWVIDSDGQKWIIETHYGDEE